MGVDSPPSPVLPPLLFPQSPPLALHDAALPLQLVGSFLFPRALAVDAQTHVPLLLQGQQLLEQLLHVGVRLGRCLHEGTLPGGGLSLALLRLHLALGRLVTFVAHEHDGNGLHGAFDGQNLQRHGIGSVRTDEASTTYLVLESEVQSWRTLMMHLFTVSLCSHFC